MCSARDTATQVSIATPVDEVKRAVGIDVGLNKFLATSGGQSLGIP